MSRGGHWEVDEEELATATARVERKVKLSVAVGLRKFILTIFLCVACRSHSATLSFENLKSLQVSVYQS